MFSLYSQKYRETWRDLLQTKSCLAFPKSIIVSTWNSIELLFIVYSSISQHGIYYHIMFRWNMDDRMTLLSSWFLPNSLSDSSLHIKIRLWLVFSHICIRKITTETYFSYFSTNPQIYKSSVRCGLNILLHSYNNQLVVLKCSSISR